MRCLDRVLLSADTGCVKCTAYYGRISELEMTFDRKVSMLLVLSKPSPVSMVAIQIPAEAAKLKPRIQPPSLLFTRIRAIRLHLRFLSATESVAEYTHGVYRARADSRLYPPPIIVNVISRDPQMLRRDVVPVKPLERRPEPSTFFGNLGQDESYREVVALFQ